MKLRTIFTFVLIGVFSFGTNAQDKTVSGVTFPQRLKIGKKTIEYNGAGLRTKYFFKLYVSALYIPKVTSDVQLIINQNEVSAVRLRLLSNKVTRDKFVETVREGFKTSTEGRATPKQIDGLMKLFNVEFKEGDDILLLYQPSNGINVYMNSKHIGNVGDLEFKKALWGIWLGQKPVDIAIKNAMLGK